MFFSGVFTSGFPYVLISIFYVMGLLFHGTGGNLMALPEQHVSEWSKYPVCQDQELFLPGIDKPAHEEQTPCKQFSCPAFMGATPVLAGLPSKKYIAYFPDALPLNAYQQGVSSRAPPFSLY
jgi:hypothetical protein